MQFDRIFDIYAGPVLIFASSTSEPASALPNAVTHWHIDTDVSRLAGLMATDQPITAILNNVNNSTYTGQYQVTLSLTFYATGSDAPAVKVPDVIVPVLPANTSDPSLPGNYGGDGYAVLNASTSSYQQDVTLPRNLLSLQADVYAARAPRLRGILVGGAEPMRRGNTVATSYCRNRWRAGWSRARVSCLIYRRRWSWFMEPNTFTRLAC